MAMKTLNKTQLETLKTEIQKVALNVTQTHETGHLADGTKVDEIFTEITTALHKICICEYKTVREQGAILLVL